MGTTNLKRTLRHLVAVQVVYSVVLLVAFIMVFAGLLRAGVIMPANQAEMQLAETEAGLSDGSLSWENVSDAFYVKAMNKEGDVLFNDIPARYDHLIVDAQIRGQALESRMIAPVFAYYIEGTDQNVVLLYAVSAQFADKTWRQWVPSVDFAFLLFFVAAWVIGLLIWINRFAVPYQRDFKELVAVNRAIAEGDLAFEVPSSRIGEFQDVFRAIETMKDALEVSLKAEWETKQKLTDNLRAIAHDVRTPLTLIQGNLELLSESQLSPQQRVYLEHAQNGVVRFNDYLADIQRLGEGKAQSESFQPLTTEIWNAWVILAENIAETKGIRVQASIMPSPAVQVMPLVFAKAFQNVVQNAVDHAPENSTITLAMGPVERGYAVTVEDQGQGFSQEALAHAFQEGYSTQTASGTHRGLGLTIARDMMRRQQGAIQLENRPEGGARVILWLTKSQ